MSRVKKRALSLLLAALMVFNTIPNMPEMVAHAAEVVSGTYEIMVDKATETLTAEVPTAVIKGRASWSNATDSNATSSNATPWATNNNAIKAESDNEAVIVEETTIDANGDFKVSIKAVDFSADVEATITIGLEDDYMGNKDTVKITVEPEEPGDKVESIEITGPKSVVINENIILVAKATPSDAEVEWVVEDDMLEYISTTVDKTDGNKLNVKGLKAIKEAKVTANLKGSEATTTYTFEVKDNPPVDTKVESVKFVDFDSSEINWAMSAGLTKTFKAVVLPTGSNQNVKWTSSNEEVATVVDGVVKAKAEGNVQIKAISAESTDDKEIAAVCNLVVVEPKLLLEYYNLELVKGNEREFLINTETIGIGGDNAVGKITVLSSDLDVVDAKVSEVDNDVINLVAKSVGTAVITVKLDGIEETCNVKVSASATTATEIDDVINELIEVLLDPDATKDQKKIVLDKAISVAAKVDFANAADVEALQSLENVISQLLSNVFNYEGPKKDVTDTVLDVHGMAGAYMNLLDYAFKDETGITPVVSLDDVAVPSNVIPSTSVETAFAVDINLNAYTDRGTIIPMNNLEVPVILTLKIPAGSGETDGKTLKICHLDSNGKSKEPITPVINDDGTVTFGTKSFSTFIFYYAPTGSSYNPHGGGNSGGSGIGSSGNLAGTWVQDATGWWFKTTTNDFPANEWAKINNKWYHFDAAGYMQTGWINVNNVWYFLNADGAMAENAWVNHNNKWYYVHTNGTMLASQWLLDNGSWYYLNTDGSMAVSTTTPDGNTVNADGVWIQ